MQLVLFIYFDDYHLRQRGCVLLAAFVMSVRLSVGKIYVILKLLNGSS